MQKGQRISNFSAWVHTHRGYIIFFVALCCVSIFIFNYQRSSAQALNYQRASATTTIQSTTTVVKLTLDTLDYDKRMDALAHIPRSTSTPALGVSATSSRATTTKRLWPVHTVYPNVGAIPPFSRIVAYYGNFYSRAMGVLGQSDASTTRARLNLEVARWNAADPNTPAIPAVDYIAITAQASPGFDGKYRARMPGSEIDKAIAFARSMHGIVILDIQVGLSDVKTEVPLFKQYLSQPDVHLAIDPEFSMHNGKRPGTVIGSEDAANINWTLDYLATIVRDKQLPPKILVIHRFTGDMLTHYKQIVPLPEVQVVIDMDGWGTPKKKFGTYSRVVTNEPIQFGGFKLFYKNDLFAPSTHLLTPTELLELTPQPIFIQYQ